MFNNLVDSDGNTLKIDDHLVNEKQVEAIATMARESGKKVKEAFGILDNDRVDSINAELKSLRDKTKESLLEVLAILDSINEKLDKVDKAHIAEEAWRRCYREY